ncbi:ABC transporter ATP-binding protein [Sediminivirga luteola]|nr:ABC transporter ATP-binding protein [Sediminivirga luteola]
MSQTRDAARDPGAVSTVEGAGIEITSAVKQYGGMRALDGVDLSVRPGEFVALLGPSGSGKTTLLMALAGFVDLDAGEVTIGGTPQTRVPPYKRNLGMVFQRYALFPHLTVEKNIAYPLRNRRWSRDAKKQAIAEVLELTDMSHLAGRKVHQLSGGQQQRVALARALVYKPPVLLMDEPLGALDRKLREQVQLEIRKIHRVLGTTIIFVTHDQGEAMSMADRIAVMNHGQILQTDTPEELYNRPVDEFVAAFVGKMNFFLRDPAGQDRPVDADAALDSANTGENQRFGIRPERTAIAAPGNGLDGQVTEVIFEGSMRHVLVDVGGITVRVQESPEEPRRSLGDTVSIRWRKESEISFAQQEN